MIINKIILNNLGPFVGENIITIKYSNKKPIKLIGGKNGAGKTTFFNSLKIGMYGCKAFGYEVNNANYFNKIAKLINDKISIKENNEASVAISITVDDGEHFGNYCIKRIWKRNKNNLTEEKMYFCDDKLLTEEDSSNFENLIIHLIPPSLFEFYFFDGEKISEILTDDGSTTNFKNAFVKICGLDNLDYLIQCFKNNSEKTSKNKTLAKAFSKAKTKYEFCKNQVNDLKTNIEAIENKIIDNNHLLAQIKKDYAKIGGVSPAEWKNLNLIINEEENLREKYRKELKDIGNHYLPFIILKDNLLNLKKILISSNSNDSINKTIETLESKAIQKEILKLFKDEKSYNEAIEILKRKNKSNKEVFYSLSNNEIIRVLNQIDEKLSFDEKRICIIENQIKESLEKTKNIRLQMAGANIDEYEKFSKDCSNINNEITLLLNKKEFYSNDLVKSLVAFNEAESIYLKIKKDYEEDIKRVSVHDISSRGYMCFSDLSKELYENYLKNLKENFKFYFDLLINKEHLVDGIYITDSLSVYPYRMITTTSIEMEKLYNELGKENFINKIGEYAYSVFKNNHKKEFLLPIKIKGTLSEGENQVYLMSLYLALTKLANNRIPFIIDTPFGRIDKDHRKNILKTFFMNLDGQMIILSTDEEINNENIDQIKDKINGTDLFQNDGHGKTIILNNKYFGGITI